MSRTLLLVGCALVAAACGPDGTTQVRAKLAWEPESLDFGQRPVLNDLVLPVELLNIGSAPLSFSHLGIEGDPAFTLLETLEGLEGGVQRELLVRFLPTEMREYTGTLVLESDDEDNPRVEIPLTGEGSTAATALIDPLSLDFGRVGEGRSALRRVRITSTGTADLKIRTIAFAEGTSAAYGFVGSTRTPQELPAHVEGVEDAFAEITVKFAPTSAVTETSGTLVLETTDPDNARIEIPLSASINRQPVAEPGSDRQVAPGLLVELDGSASFDPDGDDPITFFWTLAQKPQNSSAELLNAETATPSFTPDQPGLFAVDLVVTDAAGLSSAPRRVNISGITSDKLVVTLVWDHDTADLDLHMMPVGASFDGALDCSWPNPTPDWGVMGDPEDDPRHFGDRLSGFGPEQILYEAPADGVYSMAVKYVSSQGSASPALRATVRVYLYGVIVRELTRSMSSPGEIWNVATVEWPSGIVGSL